MQLSALDWGIIISFFIITLLIGVAVTKKAGKNSSEFFLSGRNMPWWLLGVSMVATTFAADTPNLVAGIVRQDGVSGNWVWWAFLLTGMLTVFVYARLWRRLGISTDLEYYEIRYQGKAAGFLRGFRAVYLGVFFNIVIMATVCLAGIKIGETMLGLVWWKTLGITGIITILYSMLGGLRGVIFTDFFQFIVAMIGSIWAAYYIVNLPEVGGMSGLLSNELVQSKLDFVPSQSSNEQLWLMAFVIPLAVQWWSVWYPGAEPGGGGYIAQRMLSAKDEKHATKATLFFNFAHYALRPWPWILIGLASLVIFPDIASLQAEYPDMNPDLVKHDLAYPAMLTYLPAGLLGLVLASLISAFMSTISTHLNWGSSYVVNDLYKRFIKPDATEKQLVMVGRLSTVLMMVFAIALAPILEEAKMAFDLILTIGAGTGLLFILRWFWKDINPYSEITAMTVSFLVAMFFFTAEKNELMEIDAVTKLLSGILITTVAWVAVTFITKNNKHLNPEFEKRAFADEGKFKNMGYKVLSMVLGTITIYSALFCTGKFILGDTTQALYFFIVFAVTSVSLYFCWKKIFK
ncbi:Na+:solute symporter [Paracrocinitomix mangrovi]|uniref:sodium:solute symporter family protein n=1 Tax=Paracrocinitomix mangrovi TaxID=2862509 RepID=UPI001C8ECAD0|nr:sodium:solute symporter family protein [Paracrocinitomix mangrovi]UKN00627.1 Na+:solute symporter [Paracrocinitomix mangrovi]